MSHKLLDLLRIVSTGGAHADVSLREAVKLVEGCLVFDEVHAWNKGAQSQGFDSPCLVIPLTPPVPEPTDYDRALAKVALTEASLNPNWAATDRMNLTKDVARAISAKRKELDNA